MAVPLFIAAGVLKYPSQLEGFLRLEDPDVVPALTIGSFSTHAERGNRVRYGGEDFIYDFECSAAGNALGLPNGGKEALVDFTSVIRQLSAQGVRTIVSITNLPSESPAKVVPDLAAFVADTLKPTAIEVNLGCPNGVDTGGNFYPPVCNSPDASAEVMGLTRKKIGMDVCLGAKDGPHTDSTITRVNSTVIDALAARIAPYIDFVTGINTIGAQEFPGITCAGGRGGMSGPIVAGIAKQHLQAWHAAAPNVAYLSCGGVDSNNAASEVPERLAMGALLVGGAQEFYRAQQPHMMAIRWAEAYARTL